jgi:hypothetical protein
MSRLIAAIYDWPLRVATVNSPEPAMLKVLNRRWTTAFTAGRRPFRYATGHLEPFSASSSLPKSGPCQSAL